MKNSGTAPWMSLKSETVAEYLAALPKDLRTALEKLRLTIRAAAPEAEEVISYRIPTFKLNGGLVAYAAFADHCSFFVMSPKVMRAHADLLAGYSTGKGTVHFTTDRPLPARLVKTLVQARIAENTAARRSAAKSGPKKKTAPRVRRAVSAGKRSR